MGWCGHDDRVEVKKDARVGRTLGALEQLAETEVGVLGRRGRGDIVENVLFRL